VLKNGSLLVLTWTVLVSPALAKVTKFIILSKGSQPSGYVISLDPSVKTSECVSVYQKGIFARRPFGKHHDEWGSLNPAKIGLGVDDGAEHQGRHVMVIETADNVYLNIGEAANLADIRLHDAVMVGGFRFGGGRYGAYLDEARVHISGMAPEYLPKKYTGRILDRSTVDRAISATEARCEQGIAQSCANLKLLRTLKRYWEKKPH
jgi:hypothetical protein